MPRDFALVKNGVIVNCCVVPDPATDGRDVDPNWLADMNAQYEHVGDVTALSMSPLTRTLTQYRHPWIGWPRSSGGTYAPSPALQHDAIRAMVVYRNLAGDAPAAVTFAVAPPAAAPIVQHVAALTNGEAQLAAPASGSTVTVAGMSIAVP